MLIDGEGEGSCEWNRWDWRWGLGRGSIRVVILKNGWCSHIHFRVYNRCTALARMEMSIIILCS